MGILSDIRSIKQSLDEIKNDEVYKQLVNVQNERAKIHKALDLLKEQEWSVEFLVALLNKAVYFKKNNCQVLLRNKNGQELLITCDIPITQDISNKDQQLDVLAGNVTLEALLDAAEVQGVL